VLNETSYRSKKCVQSRVTTVITKTLLIVMHTVGASGRSLTAVTRYSLFGLRDYSVGSHRSQSSNHGHTESAETSQLKGFGSPSASDCICIDSQVAVRLSALSAGRALPPGRSLALVSTRDWVDPRALKNYLPTCSIVRQPLRYRVPPQVESSKRFFFLICSCRSQWPRGLRHELSSPAPTLRSWVRIPRKHVCLCVFCVRFFCFYIISSETASRPNKRLMRTYHWISLFMSYIKSAN
jgi:hypothetical protein